MAEEQKKKSGKKENALKLEGMSIKMKLILTIIPIVAVLLIALTAITTIVSRNLLLDRTNNEMAAVLGQHTNSIGAQLQDIRAQADTVARMVAGTYHSATVDDYGYALTEVVESSDLGLGAGLWFEPNVLDADSEYYGPYWYKNTDSNGNWDWKDPVLTWDYSNAE